MENRLPTEDIVGQIEALLKTKIERYAALVEVAKAESAALVASDQDALWRLSTQKQEVVVQIEALRQEVLAVLSAQGIAHGMSAANFRMADILHFFPGKTGGALQRLHVKLGVTKQELNRLLHENRRFVEASLKTVNDLMGIFTGGQDLPPGYGNAPAARRSGQTNLLLYREV